MRIEEALARHLEAHPGVSAIVGDRIYPRRLPEGSELPAAQMPAMTYSLISNLRQRDLDGVAYYRARVQVSCWAASYGDTKLMVDAIADALEGLTGLMQGVHVIKAEIDNENDQGEEELGLYHSPVDVLIIYRGGN